MYIAPRKKWYLERLIRLVAGLFILASTLLGYYVSVYWYILDILVGVSLVIFAFTGFCLMANILVKLGAKPKIVK